MIKNRVRFTIYNIEYGKKLIVHGHVGLDLDPEGTVSIGDNFYMSNGRHLNPLSGNNEGHIHVEKNAALIIGNNVGISATRIWCSKSIVIGNNVKIGAGVTIIDSDAHSLNCNIRKDKNLDQTNKKDKDVVIKDDVFIGMNSIILKGVTLGKGSVIGAGSVVSRDIPDNCIAVGNPCIVIKQNINC